VAVTAMGPDAVAAQAKGAQPASAIAQAVRVKRKVESCSGIRVFRGTAAHRPVGIKSQQMDEWCTYRLETTVRWQTHVKVPTYSQLMVVLWCLGASSARSPIPRQRRVFGKIALNAAHQRIGQLVLVGLAVEFDFFRRVL
jgi:hypothetical protein